jgi:uncharacterized protein (DUF1015 family)
MTLIRPFAALRPAPEFAAQVAAPPYDVLNSEEARVRATGKPWSFLHVSKPEIDLPAGTDPYSAAVYAKAAESLRHMLDNGILKRDPAPCYYAYRLICGNHSQIGLVAAASLAAYESNRIRRHELTRPDKEDDRVRHMEALDAQTGPVMMAYPDAPEADGLLALACEAEPESDLTADDGVRHSIWPIHDSAAVEQLTRTFEALPALYIADGHHRTAAASRVAAARRAKNPQHTGRESYNYFLCVMFPYRQMQILDYNRVVADLNRLAPEEFLARVANDFLLKRSDTQAKPVRSGEFGLYVQDQWYTLTLKPGLLATSDPIARLDVSVLSQHLLSPVLGIDDLRSDKRVDFVGGIRGLSELERRVDSGAMAAGFALFPTRIEDLMAVADSGQIMPPKSTWFEPKLADGLVIQELSS